jgi:hypothetical protein
MCDFGMVALVGVWPNSAWSLFVVDGDYENRSARKSEVRPRKANQTISRDKYKWHEEPKPLSCRDILLLCGSTISKGWKLNDNFGWSVRLIEWRPSARTVWGGSFVFQSGIGLELALLGLLKPPASCTHHKIQSIGGFSTCRHEALPVLQKRPSKLSKSTRGPAKSP